MNPLFQNGEYFCSKTGDIFSRKNGRHGVGSKSKKLSPFKLKNGYLVIRISLCGRAQSFYMHRIVWEFFNGPIPKGFIIHHKNSIRNDNRISNLDLLTQSSNIKVARNQNKIGKLTLRKVKLIKQKLENGFSPSLIAKDFGVTPTSIRAIKRKETWLPLSEF